MSPAASAMAEPPASNGRSGRGPSVPGVVRAAAILTELARADGQSLSDLAGHVRLPKSTAFDVCSGLAAHELLTRDSDGRYHLGRHIETLASSWVDGTSALQRFARVCATQDELDGKTVTLHTLAGSSVLCLDVRLGTQPLPETPRPGVRLGLTDSGPGAAILTAATDEELDALLRRAAGFEGLATQDIVAIRAVGAEFRSGRRAVPSPDGTVALARARAVGDGRRWLAVAVLLPARNGTTNGDGVAAAVERVLDALVGATGTVPAP